MAVRFADSEPRSDTWVALHRAADRHVGDVERAFRAAVDLAREAATLAALSQRLRASPTSALDSVPWDRMRAVWSEGQARALDAAFAAGARVEADRLGGRLGLRTRVVAKQGPVDVNVATAAELQRLPGVGPATAALIVSERDRLGGFANVAHFLQSVPRLSGDQVLGWAEQGLAVLGGRSLFPLLVPATVGPGTLELVGAFDLTNPRVVRLARSEAAALVQGITVESRRAMRDVLARAQVFGLNVRSQSDELAAILRATIGLDSRRARALMNFERGLVEAGVQGRQLQRLVEQKRQALLRQRARVIARNETLQLAGEGQREVWRQATAQGLLPEDQRRELVTTPDARTCEICRPAGRPTGERQVVGMDEPAVSPFNGAQAMRAGGFHVQCVPADAAVTLRGSLLGVSRRDADIDLVVLRVSGQLPLSVTPNHPVLTRRGWVPAHAVNVSDQIVCPGLSERPAAGDGDGVQVPTRAQDIGDAFLLAGEVVAVKVPVAAPDFHGDGRDGEVAVVGADRLLLDRLKSAHDEHVTQGDLMLRNVGVDPRSLSGQRSFALGLEGLWRSATGLVGSGHLSGALGVRHERPLDPLGGGSSAPADARLAEPAADDVARHAKVLSETILRPKFARVEAHDLIYRQIDSVGHHPYSGPVYNFHTSSNYYVTNGYATHNCRCVFVLVDMLELREAA